MKVLFVSTGDAKYGAPKSMMALMKKLKADYQVECILLTKKHNELNEECDALGIENYSMYYSDIMAGSSYEKWYLNTAKHIVKYMMYLLGSVTKSKVKHLGIDFSTVDIVHSNTNRVDIGAYIAKEYGIPHIWHLREMDEATKGMCYYKKNWQSYMNENVTKYIAITKVVKESWANKGLDEDKIKVIYNGVDETKIHTSNCEYDDTLRIVGVGRIEKSKGQEDLIAALCNMQPDLQKNITVDFIGESYKDYKDKLLKMMEESDCKSTINFKGYSTTVLEDLKDYDLGITCSPAEAFGRTTVEYMMAKLLVVATDTGANPELIEDNKTGLLYKQGDSEQLRLLLEKVMANKEDMLQMRENGYQSAITNFTAAKNAEEVYQLYSEIVTA